MARAVVLWMAQVEQKYAGETPRISMNPVLQPAMKPDTASNNISDSNDKNPAR